MKSANPISEPSENEIQRQLELRSQPFPIATLFTLYLDGKFRVNRRYQRKLVWTPEEKSELIESIYNGYPIPGIILNDTGSQVYEIIDGMQRLDAIFSYLEQRSTDGRGNYFNVDNYPAAREHIEQSGVNVIQDPSALAASSQSNRFLAYTLQASIVASASEEDVKEVFRRINSYGRRLSNQERRQAGVDNDLANLVRDLATYLRNDLGENGINLGEMPSITYNPEKLGTILLGEVKNYSVESRKAKMGYSVNASDTFWVQKGILNSVDLRSSEDEKVIADILGSILNTKDVLLSTDRKVLDELYSEGSELQNVVLSELHRIGAETLKKQIIFCFAQVDQMCKNIPNIKLQRHLYYDPSKKKVNSNKFPSAFAVLLVAIYELCFRSSDRVEKEISEENSKEALDQLLGVFGANMPSSKKGEKGRGEMFKIVQQRLKGSVTPIAKDRVSEIYQSKTLEGILALPCENGRIEFKQGMYDLSPGRKRVKLDKIAKTLVAIANLGPSGYDLNAGYLIVGVADTKRDADKINSLDGVKAPLISENYVVGLDREFNLSGKAIDSEAYLHMVRDDLHKEPISEPLKSKILSNLEMVTLYGQKLLVFRVEAIGKLSRYDNDVYVRDLDQTLKYKKADVMYLEDLIYEIRDKYRSALNH